jgi:hypothetical protein
MRLRRPRLRRHRACGHDARRKLRLIVRGFVSLGRRLALIHIFCFLYAAEYAARIGMGLKFNKYKEIKIEKTK